MALGHVSDGGHRKEWFPQEYCVFAAESTFPKVLGSSGAIYKSQFGDGETSVCRLGITESSTYLPPANRDTQRHPWPVT